MAFEPYKEFVVALFSLIVFYFHCILIMIVESSKQMKHSTIHPLPQPRQQSNTIYLLLVGFLQCIQNSLRGALWTH